MLSAAVRVVSEGRAAALAASLRDQNGRPGGFEPSGGQPSVVFVVSAARLKRLKAWESRLRQRFEGLRFVRVADVPPARPPARYEDVARRLREHVPREVSVLIDVDRLWATGFEIDSRQVNVLVLDAAGRLAGQLAGDPTPERLAQAVALVRPLAPPSGRRGPRDEGRRPARRRRAGQRPDRLAPSRPAAGAARRPRRAGGAPRGQPHLVVPHERPRPRAGARGSRRSSRRSWTGYDVRFPGLGRRLAGGYHSVTSEGLDRALARALGGERRCLGRGARDVSAGRRHARRRERDRGACVIDGRGFPAARLHERRATRSSSATRCACGGRTASTAPC